jgi:hypothetical protein
MFIVSFLLALGPTSFSPLTDAFSPLTDAPVVPAAAALEVAAVDHEPEPSVKSQSLQSLNVKPGIKV